MISYAEAVSILETASTLPVQTTSLSNAIGQIIAEDIVSPMSVPSFANSAMDGFAVRASDCGSLPAILSVVGETAAGDIPASGSGQAWAIMTGAAVPDGYDTVIPIEKVVLSEDEKSIRIEQAVKQGANIRLAGEDFQRGNKIVPAGDRLSSFHQMALSALGIGKVSVRNKPRVRVISTGKEIIDDLSQPLGPGQIFNSNAPYLMTALTELGTQSTYAGLIKDEPEKFEALVKAQMASSDLIVSTGAVSAGKYDFIPSSLENLGGKILFHKVAIRPGKPVLYARLPDGTHYLGLPGNPVSAAVGLKFFGQPLLRRMTGQPVLKPVKASLYRPFQKSHNLRFFTKAKLSSDAAGGLRVEILPGQQSFKIHPLLKTNSWAVIPEATKDLLTGDIVDTYPIGSL